MTTNKNTNLHPPLNLVTDKKKREEKARVDLFHERATQLAKQRFAPYKEWQFDKYEEIKRSIADQLKLEYGYIFHCIDVYTTHFSQWRHSEDGYTLNAKEQNEYYTGMIANLALGRAVWHYAKSKYGDDVEIKRRVAHPRVELPDSTDGMTLEDALTAFYDAGGRLLPSPEIMGFFSRWASQTFWTAKSKMEGKGWVIERVDNGYWEFVSKPETQDDIDDALLEELGSLSVKQKQEILRVLQSR